MTGAADGDEPGRTVTRGRLWRRHRSFSADGFAAGWVDAQRRPRRAALAELGQRGVDGQRACRARADRLRHPRLAACGRSASSCCSATWSSPTCGSAPTATDDGASSTAPTDPSSTVRSTSRSPARRSCTRSRSGACRLMVGDEAELIVARDRRRDARRRAPATQVRPARGAPLARRRPDVARSSSTSTTTASRPTSATSCGASRESGASTPRRCVNVAEQRRAPDRPMSGSRSANAIAASRKPSGLPVS